VRFVCLFSPRTASPRGQKALPAREHIAGGSPADREGVTVTEGWTGVAGAGDHPSRNGPFAGAASRALKARTARRRSVVIASSTVAFATGGALAGAVAFSAFPPSIPGAGGSSLAASAVQVPGDTGNLCTSTRNTSTAADTALSCESLGLSSFAVHLARSTVSARQGLSRLLAGATGSRTRAGMAPAGSATANGSGGAGGGHAGSAPGGTTARSAATCEAMPAPSAALPGSGSASISVSSSATGGAVSVHAGSGGLTICATAPSTTQLPGAPSIAIPSLPSLPRLPGGEGSTTRRHHHRSRLGGLGGLLGGLTGGSGL